jgi:hypothetical protein
MIRRTATRNHTRVTGSGRNRKWTHRVVWGNSYVPYAVRLPVTPRRKSLMFQSNLELTWRDGSGFSCPACAVPRRRGRAEVTRRLGFCEPRKNPTMSSTTITSLTVYPVKSCGGIGVVSATLTETGLRWDRAW